MPPLPQSRAVLRVLCDLRGEVPTAATGRDGVRRRAAILGIALATAFASCDSAVTTRGGARVESISIESRAMGKPWPALVILPPAYFAEKERRFPVLYLLHGASGDHQSWVRYTSVLSDIEKRELIVVCPYGRTYGWYVDSPRRENSKVETHVVKELVPHIDANYRTVAGRESRAIAGYSMGGHGAVTLAAKHPEMFVSASSLSGILDITRWPRHWMLTEVFGPMDESREFWVANSAMGLAKAFTASAKEVSLFVDCGRADVAFEENRDFHRLLGKLGVAHVYKDRPGGHNWEYWSDHIAEHLDFHLKCMGAASEAVR
jgi:S-formylglutathione hydrolase FrmB